MTGAPIVTTVRHRGAEIPIKAVPHLGKARAEFWDGVDAYLDGVTYMPQLSEPWCRGWRAARDAQEPISIDRALDPRHAFGPQANGWTLEYRIRALCDFEGCSLDALHVLRAPSGLIAGRYCRLHGGEQLELREREATDGVSTTDN